APQHCRLRHVAGLKRGCRRKISTRPAPRCATDRTFCLTRQQHAEPVHHGRCATGCTAGPGSLAPYLNDVMVWSPQCVSTATTATDGAKVIDASAPPPWPC